MATLVGGGPAVALLAGTVEALADPAALLDAQGAVLASNRAMEALLGFRLPVGGELQAVVEVAPPAARHHLVRLGRAVGDVVGGGAPHHEREARFVHADGRARWASLRVDPVVGDGAVLGALVVVRDHAEQRALARSLEVAEQRLRALFDRSPFGLGRLDGHGHLLQGNATLARLIGVPDEVAIGAHLEALVRPGDRAAVAAALDQLRDGAANARVDATVEQDGDDALVQLVLSSISSEDGEPEALLLAQDVTEQRRLEAELNQAHKLEAVGRLAAGVAHEINTPMQFISDNVRFLGDAVATLVRLRDVAAEAIAGTPAADGLASFEAEHDVAFLLEEVPSAAAQARAGLDRVATIVHAMKVFGRFNQVELAPADLTAGLRATAVVAGHALKPVADLEVDVGSLPLVRCNLGDINQVVLNLLVNAGDAVADRGDGRRGRVVLRASATLHEVVVEVEDDGCGIPDEVARRVYEPFFSTKEVGRGTGQGLALARRVLEQHGGAIGFTSRPGEGTCFALRLPLEGPA